MSVMSIREFNANVSKALARVESGEAFEITKNGRVFAEVRPKTPRRSDDPVWRASFDALIDDIEKGVPFGRRFSHDERNG